jgi:hypothetical protein
MFIYYELASLYIVYIIAGVKHIDTGRRYILFIVLIYTAAEFPRQQSLMLHYGLLTLDTAVGYYCNLIREHRELYLVLHLLVRGKFHSLVRGKGRNPLACKGKIPLACKGNSTGIKARSKVRRVSYDGQSYKQARDTASYSCEIKVKKNIEIML